MNSASELRFCDIASTRVATANPNMPLTEAIPLFAENRLSSLIVVDTWGCEHRCEILIRSAALKRLFKFSVGRVYEKLAAALRQLTLGGEGRVFNKCRRKVNALLACQGETPCNAGLAGSESA